VNAGVVRVLSPSAVHSSLEAIADAYRQRGGDRVELTFETAPALARRLAAGAAADVVIAPPNVMRELVTAGKADPAGPLELGRVGVGVAVRIGAPLPEVSSTQALKRAILDADSIVHTRASSGIYVARLLERLGVAAAASARTTTYHDAQGAFTHLVNGSGREIGFGGITEIRRWRDRGLRLVAPLPPDVQNYTAYVAALAMNAPNLEGARAFMRFLGSPAAVEILVANGVERPA
jgi:molybdate transport system substrate-binding protein